MVRLELATLDYKPSALAIELQELKSYCWEGVEFIQLVYCIIIYLSFIISQLLWLEHWVCNPGVASSSLTIGILTVNFSTGTRSFCVQ